MAAAEAVRIRHLRVRGPDDARQQVARALERAPWPARPGAEVLILRRLELAATPEELGAAAARQAEALAARAVDGWSPAAADAPAVRFASHAELLACLVRDLLAGRAQRLWFWAGWRALFGLPPAAAAARALARQPLELPAALAALEPSAPAWQRFWTELPEAETAELLAAVQRDTGWPVARPDRAGAERRATDGTAPAVARALRRLPSSFMDPAGAPARLAALWVAWTAAPQRLDAPGAGPWLTGLARQLSRPGAEPRPPRKPAAAAAEPPAVPASFPPGAGTLAQGAQSPHGPKPAAADGSQAKEPAGAAAPAEPPPSSAGGAEPTLPHPGPGSGSRPRSSPGRGDAPAPRPTEADAASRGPGRRPAEATEPSAESPAPEPTWHFVTSRGGLFLLLNFLRIGAVQRRLVADPEPRAGWRWLLAAGRGLGLEPDPPLTRFLAAELDLDDPGQLPRLPAMALEPALRRLGRRRFGAQVWNPELLRLDALVWADRSHLEVHCRMADVRLPVRRAGLDVDPGWLPWLGRVVRFHYDDPPELGPANTYRARRVESGRWLGQARGEKFGHSK